MIYIKPRKIIENGIETGKWRLTVSSDNPISAPHGLCNCPGGHDTEEEASNCPVAMMRADNI
jgi:hypothetical protein